MTLFWKFYLTCTAMVLLTAAALTAANTHREARNKMAVLLEEHRLLATLVATQVETGYAEQLWPFEMLHTIAAKPSFTSWQIVDGNGQVVLANDPATTLQRVPPAQCLIQSPAIVQDSGDELVWAVPMRMRTGSVHWTFRLGFSTHSVAALVHEVVLINLLWACSVCVLLIPFSIWLTRRFLRPLQQLTHSVRQMEEGNLSAPLPPPGHDEVGKLIHAFDGMSNAVRAAQTNLEHRVEERTAQLDASKRAAEQVAASLHRNNAEMQAIHRTALDGVLVLDARWAITSFNPAAERIFGCSASDAVGRLITDFVPQLLQSDSSPEPLLGQRRELRARRLDGAEFPAEMAILAAEITGPAVYIASVRDLTERKRAEAEREELNKRLLSASRRAGMAEVATGVLHNVGNVLNSVNVSTNVILERVRQSNVGNLSKAAAMIDAHRDDLGSFLTQDPKGRQLPAYLSKFAAAMGETQKFVLDELAALARGVDHIKQVVQLQQTHASSSTLYESVSTALLLQDALQLSALSLERHRITTEVHIAEQVQELTLDKHKTLQVLVNLISNAKNAMKMLDPDLPRKITIAVATARRDDGSPGVRFAVTDTGVGISPQTLARIFNHGFTTRSSGHGFGLHSCANAAREMNGTLTASSDGPGRGATFILELPVNARCTREQLTTAA